ncbi:Uncharacterized protein MSYG_4177 [Malassezia sympodialis ATCC 42132]|uniref:ABM domain-containing protein n=1 Tax=Malassezia sympodialis (strain ATCC 42132) TaxID=1230383 RepID=A0A1M8ABW3_MALS4|nr:Uncharacterized protein MSYG_4177 [Malassezia sympodialis ATCC 42132]
MSAPKQGPFILVASIVAKGASEAEVLQDMLLAVTKKANTAEAGTKTYRLGRDVNDTLKFVVYEEYADEAAFEAHKTSPEFQALFQKVGELTTAFDFQFLHELHP